MGTLLGTVAGAALLVAGAAGCGGSSSSGGSGKISQPDTIASLKKSPDQTMAQGLLKQAKSDEKDGTLTAVIYQDSSESAKKVFIYGGVGIQMPSGSSEEQFKDMLGSGTATDSGVKLGSVADVDAGDAGGKAQCAPIKSSGGGDSKYVNCAWINGKSALVLSFTSFSADDAQSLVPQILTAMTQG